MEAIQIGLGSNRHGLALNDGDKAYCIRIAVKEFPLWSNRRIARLIGCNCRYVDRIVNEGQLRTGTHVVGTDGKTYPVAPVQSKEKLEPAPVPPVPKPTVLAPLVGGFPVPVVGRKLTQGWQQPVEPPVVESTVSKPLIPKPPGSGFPVVVLGRKLTQGPPELAAMLERLAIPTVKASLPNCFFKELKTAWRRHQTKEPDKWAKGVVEAFNEMGDKMYDACPTDWHRLKLKRQLQDVFRNWDYSN